MKTYLPQILNYKEDTLIAQSSLGNCYLNAWPYFAVTDWTKTYKHKKEEGRTEGGWGLSAPLDLSGGCIHPPLHASECTHLVDRHPALSCDG